MNEQILKSLMRYTPEVNHIITPLKSMGILGVFYTRLYTNGILINLASDARWTEFYFKKSLSGVYKSDDIEDQYFAHFDVSLWALNQNNPIWQDGKYFGYGNGITLSYNAKNFREIMGFYASSDNNRINHFYINNINKIKKMREQFLFQSTDLIKKSEEERCRLAHSIFSSTLHHPISCDDRESIDYYFLLHVGTGLPIRLPAQRRQCLSHLVSGKSTKEIACAMNLSAKTIEHYLELLRKELGCRSSRELIAAYGEQLSNRVISPY